MSKSMFYRACCLVTLIGFTYLATSLIAQNEGTARRHTVKYLDASKLESRVSKMLAEFGLAATVAKDPASNALIIDGAPEAQRIAAQLLATIDKKPVEPKPAVALPEISKPAAAANEVRGYTIDPNLLQATAANLAAKYPTARILPDARTGQLVVIATPQVQAAVSRHLGTTAPRPTQNNAATQHQLENISPQQLEAKIRQLLGDRVQIATNNLGTTSTFNVTGPNNDLASLQLDRNSGVLSAKGDGAQVRSWMQLAAALDKSNLQADSGAQVVPVKRADPQTVGEAINLVKQAAAAEGQAVNVVNPAKDKKWGGDLVANIFQQDPNANPEADIPAVDENGEPIGRTVLRVEPEEAGLLGPVQIEFIEGLGVFIIKGHKADVARVIEIIEQIEQHTRDTQPEVIVHALQNVNSTVLAELVSNLYDDVFGTRNSPVSITPLDKPNALLLIGRAESMEAIINLIEKLDTPVPPATTHTVINLIHMSAIDAERQIRNFYSDVPGDGNGGGDPRPGLGTRVRIVADYRTNSLIIHASPRDLAEIKQLIAKLDVEDAPATNEIKVFRLVNALAEDLQPVLQEAITGISAQGGGGQQQQQQGTGDAVISPQSSKLSIKAVMGDELIDSGILAGITVTADPNVNALVVRAPARSMPLIEELIAQLDQLPNAEAVIKVFEIVNGDATSLTQMLQQLFGLEVTAGQASTTTAFNRALSSGAGGSAESPLVPLRFSVDMRTNSIIASGALGDLDVVESLILRLDEADVETRRTQVVRLKNANAPDVADAITQYLTTQRSYIQQQLQFAQAISTYEQVNSEVIVVAEAVTNSLIVSATPRYFDEILKVIEDLDFRPSMVMIQVVIAEVELRDDFEFGVEVGLQDSLLFDRGLASIGFDWPNAAMPNDSSAGALGTRESLAGKMTSSFALGRTNPTLGYGGLVMSAANESIHVLLRALQSRGRLQILSRPQIMTLDNSSAFVNIGARVPRIQETTLTQFGIQNNAPDEEVGLILDVLPRINNDGLIVMQISAEKSELGLAADGVPISVTTTGEAINSPAINTTTAQTTISAHSGETVVFAGLITKNKTVSRRQIPWLGDLPGVGQLFRYDVEEESRKELLIIMTPHVITGKDDLDALNAMESGRMSWCLADMVEMHGDVGLAKGNGLWGVTDHCPTIYPDRDPSGKRLGDQAFPETTMSRQLESWGLQDKPTQRQQYGRGQAVPSQYDNSPVPSQGPAPAAPTRYYAPPQGARTAQPVQRPVQQPTPNYRAYEPALQPAGYQPSFSR